MDNIISLSQKIGERKQRISMEKLDAAASYVCLEKCLVYLEMNKLEELNVVKIEIKKAMKLLAEKSK
jgi:hypothetical protein